MKLEVGQFVRTKDGKIFDCYVSEQMGKPIYYPKRSKTNGYIDWNEVYKKSENIIDILEVGDYVNDLPIEDYYTRYDEEKDDFVNIGVITLEDYWKGTFTSVEDIKSIVTKEAFKSMEYMLGDK